MTSSIGRFVLIALGVVAILVGAVFAGQGANLIPGSVMTGSKMWLVIGLALVLVGIVVIVLAARRRGDRSRN